MTTDNTQEQNIIVYVKTQADDGLMYECVGVLMEDTNEYIRIAFNAHNDVVKDEVILQKTEILEYEVLDTKDIKTL